MQLCDTWSPSAGPDSLLLSDMQELVLSLFCAIVLCVSDILVSQQVLGDILATIDASGCRYFLMLRFIRCLLWWPNCEQHCQPLTAKNKCMNESWRWMEIIRSLLVYLSVWWSCLTIKYTGWSKIILPLLFDISTPGWEVLANGSKKNLN